MLFLSTSYGVAQTIEDAMRYNSSGIMAFRMKMAVGGENIANGLSLRDEETGLPYQKKYVNLVASKTGVTVEKIERSTEPFGRSFDPTVPQSDENGYYYQPNVNLPSEMIGVKYSETLFEANINAYKISKAMYQSAVDILK